MPGIRISASRPPRPCYQHRDPGDHDGDDSDSSSDGSSSHLNRCCRRTRPQQDYTLDLPYTAYRGAFLGGHYQLHQLRLQTEFLDIFSVVCLCGRVFEAQAFSLSLGADTLERPKQLMDSRRRRMKRIYRSENFVDVFEDSGRRFLVSKVDRTEKEWRDVCDQIICRDVDYATELPARLVGGRRLQQKRGGRHHGGGNGGVGGACCNFDRRLESAASGIYARTDMHSSAENHDEEIPTSYAHALMRGLSQKC